MQWLSRTIAVLIFMVSPGLLGMFIDNRWGTAFFMPAGFLIGIVLATAALLVLARKLTPQARGQALPWQDRDEPDNDADDQPS